MSTVPIGGHPAEYWDLHDDGRVECRLCPHHCVLRDGQSGRCRVRVMRNGTLFAAGYGHLSAMHVDPIEKKPLYHFHPGAEVFSVGGWGCNFACVFCQNWTISQEAQLGGGAYTAAEIVRQALSGGFRLVAYTYNEPLVGFEFVRDCCRLVREAGAKNVLVTNGYLEKAPAEELLPLVDALNIDIKSIEEEFYRRQCRGTLAPVLRFCEQAVGAGCHVEITNLMIPTLNDAPDQVSRLAAWVGEHLGAGTPLHLSAYHPDYRLEIPATPLDALERGYEAARQHLTYVYMGNVRASTGQDTVCPACAQTLITRRGYATTVTGIQGGLCRKCGRKADVVTKA